MNTKHLKYLAFALAFASAAATAAEYTVEVATGAKEGTYHSFFTSIATVCGNEVNLVEVPSSGSDDNIDKLISKDAKAAFVQSDTLQFVSMNDPRAGEGQIRVLLPMYPEEVHVVALTSLVKGGSGFLEKAQFWKAKQALNTLADLEGVAVGAWGGSYTTARTIALLGSVKYDTVKFAGPAEAKAALDKGEIAAIIAVGGQPLGFVKSLNKNYKLLSVDTGLANRVKAYQATRVSYRNLADNAIDTVAARSMLVVKNFRSPEAVAAFTKLKACIVANETTFKEGKHHPKWNDVDFAALTSWPAYEVAAPQKVSAPAKKK